MAKTSMHSVEFGRTRSSAPKIDTCAIVLILACAYSMIIEPLILYMTTYTLQDMMESSWANRIFWPVIAVSSIGLAMLHRFRLSRVAWPPHIIWLCAYLALAGASVLWALKPELSFIRFATQVMLITSIVLPGMLAARTADLMRCLFLCFALAVLLNVLTLRPQFILNWFSGYQGYLPGKNALGQFATIAILLAVHEMLYRGLRRALGIIVLVVATGLLYVSGSKTSVAFACIAPLLAGFMLIIKRTMRISPAIVLVALAFSYVVFSTLTGFNASRISYMMYGDTTFTGRTFIWDFVNVEIAKKPILGWGYQSFWLVGLDAPSFTEAPGWVKGMPHAHNGYLDTMLETGYLGFSILVIFILATLHVAGHVAERSPARGWLVLSIVLFVIFNNFLETSWMRGTNFLWVVFAVIAVEIARWRQAFPPTNAAYGSRPQELAQIGLSSPRN